MRFVFAVASLSLSILHYVTAYPSYGLGSFEKLDTNAQKRQTSPPQGAGFLPLTPPPFNAEQQLVRTDGEHAFIPPGPLDARGPCPGLNAMANHGYMPRNGFATIQQFVDGTNAVFGMAKDLASFLSIYGASVNGNGIGWSIGGIPRTGISGSHNNYETDSSPLRSDLNQYGSNRRIIIDQFTRLYNLQPDAATANYNLEVLRKFRGTRFSESVNKNPYFFYGPFTGIQVSQAAHTFIYRFMANKSAEYPEGILNKEVLKAFMAIEGPEDNLQWVPGHERIPNNWYKRNPADEYSIPYFETDLLAFASTQPQIISVGCNMGKVNSYNMISVEEISGGAYTAQDVATNPFCYSIESIRYSAPSLLGLAGSLLTGLLDMLVPLEQTFGCQPFNGNGNFTALKACPGFSIYGGPSGPVAPGAIQS